MLAISYKRFPNGGVYEVKISKANLESIQSFKHSKSYFFKEPNGGKLLVVKLGPIFLDKIPGHQNAVLLGCSSSDVKQHVALELDDKVQVAL